MFDVFLNAAKFLASKDVRESGAAIIDLIRNSQEWQKDICTITVGMDKENSENSELIRMICDEKLRSLDYEAETIEDFNFSFIEIIENAFEYGISDASKEAIYLRIDVTRAYVAFKVINGNRKAFDLLETICANRNELIKNPRRQRGRGLMTVFDLSDEMISTDGGIGVKLSFYKDRVRFDTHAIGGLFIMRVRSGLFNRSCKRRIERLAEANCDKDVVVDVSLWRRPVTSITSSCISLNNYFEERSKKFVVLLPKEESMHTTSAVEFRSWSTLLAFLGKAEFAQEIDRVMGVGDVVYY